MRKLLMAFLDDEKESGRPETGVCQFEDDWPGVFFRGDNAVGYAITLKCFLERAVETGEANAIDKATIESLIKDLEGCNLNKRRAKG